jgi:hypothetical protein
VAHHCLPDDADRPLHQASDGQVLRSPVLAATSQLVAIEADSALGPVVYGDWRTASSLFKRASQRAWDQLHMDSGMWTVATQPLLFCTARVLKRFLSTAPVSRNSRHCPCRAEPVLAQVHLWRHRIRGGVVLRAILVYGRRTLQPQPSISQQAGRPPACLHLELHRCVQTTQHAALLLSPPRPPQPQRHLPPAIHDGTHRNIGAHASSSQTTPFGLPEHTHHNTTTPGTRKSKRRGAWFPTQTRRVQSAHCPYGGPRRSSPTRRAHPPSAGIASTAPTLGARRSRPRMSSPCLRTPATWKSSSAMDARRCAICCTS